jgi:hypothetical protein
MMGELAKMYALREFENETQLRQQKQKEVLNYIFQKWFVLFVVHTLKRG